MQVSIKSLKVDMEVKNSGVEFAVYDNDGSFRGDCYVTKAGLIWCEGKTRKPNGVQVGWDEFIEWMSS
ncbi:MAG: hypothetical protein ACLFWF_10495 [Alphaproteobacteria bacterium]